MRPKFMNKFVAIVHYRKS